MSPEGIEPSTNWLKASCSTTELRAQTFRLRDECAAKAVTIKSGGARVNRDPYDRIRGADSGPQTGDFVRAVRALDRNATTAASQCRALRWRDAAAVPSTRTGLGPIGTAAPPTITVVLPARSLNWVTPLLGTYIAGPFVFQTACAK